MTAAEIEGDISSEILSGLEKRGHHLYRVSPNDANMGSIHAARIHDNGLIEGAADPRRRGLAKGL